MDRGWGEEFAADICRGEGRSGGDMVGGWFQREGEVAYGELKTEKRRTCKLDTADSGVTRPDPMRRLKGWVLGFVLHLRCLLFPLPSD